MLTAAEEFLILSINKKLAFKNVVFREIPEKDRSLMNGVRFVADLNLDTRRKLMAFKSSANQNTGATRDGAKVE
jgi:hypothetical protein